MYIRLNFLENGDYLALDLGGTNFRILLVHLHNGQIVQEEVAQYHISDELKIGAGEELFDYLADCLCDFDKKNSVADKKLPMGNYISFSNIYIFNRIR